MPHIALFSQPRRETVSLHDVFKRLYRRWLFVLVSTLVTFGLAVCYLAFATPQYTVEMEIAPPMRDSDRTGSVVSGLGALAGLGVSGSTNSSFQRYEKMLTSREVATRLVRDHHALQVIFSDRWDADRGEWKPLHGVAARLHVATARLFGRTVASEPDIEDLREFLAKRLKIEVPSGDTALEAPPAIRYITLAYRDPRIAAQLLLWLHQETDGVIREDELNRTRHMIDYLDDRLRKATEVDERASLAQLLLDQERIEMLLTTGLDYSAEVLDSPGIPREPSRPQVWLTLILSIVVGVIVSSLIAISLSTQRETNIRGTGD
jgi:capsular polysaccharide biosynthesis protein